MAEQSEGRMLLPGGWHRNCCPGSVYGEDTTLSQVGRDFDLLRLGVFVAHGFLLGRGGACAGGEPCV